MIFDKCFFNNIFFSFPVLLICRNDPCAFQVIKAYSAIILKGKCITFYYITYFDNVKVIANELLINAVGLQ